MKQLFSNAEKAIIKKDFGEIWHTGWAKMLLLAGPFCVAFVVPAVFLVVAMVFPREQFDEIHRISSMIPHYYRNMRERQAIFYVMSQRICPMFFLMVPLLSSAVAASCAFAGEKEHHTLEPLYSSLASPRTVFRAKVYGCVLLSMIVTAVSFVVFGITIGVGDLLMRLPFFFDWNWLVLLFLLIPACMMLGVAVMALASYRAKSSVEAVQLSGYLILPVILLYLLQLTGVYLLNAWVLLAVSVIFAVFAAAFLGIAARMWNRTEKLLG